MPEEGSTLVQSGLPCPCGNSSDAFSIYDDGHGYCFSGSCENPYFKDATEDGSDASPTRTKKAAGLANIEKISALPTRKLSEETCRLFQYGIGTVSGKPAQIATYRTAEGSEIVAQKIRWAGKEFTVLGDMKRAGLFGQHLWRDGGKKVVITEGEIDAMSMSQAMGNKWPVVSIPNGAQGARKALEKQLEWLERFEEVILMFDNDEAGQKAIEECASLFTPGRCKIARLPLKDPNEMLVQGRVKDLIDAMWGAREYRPDGIIGGDEISLEELQSACVHGYGIPYPSLNEMLAGLRKAEITLLTAGTGIGKSTLAREIAYHLHQAHGLKIGNVYLEESATKTAQGYVAIHNNVPLGKLRANPKIISDAAWASAHKNVISQRMYFYKHFGSLESDRLLQKLRYLAVSCGVDFIVLDHISIVISGQEASSEGERKDIDRLITMLRALGEETGVGVVAIVHLKQPEGKPHEEGGRVNLSQLRGSGGLKQLADNVVALERDQQGENSNTSLIRLLKNREHGDVGAADQIAYDRETGRLLPDKQEGF